MGTSSGALRQTAAPRHDIIMGVGMAGIWMSARRADVGAAVTSNHITCAGQMTISRPLPSLSTTTTPHARSSLCSCVQTCGLLRVLSVRTHPEAG